MRILTITGTRPELIRLSIIIKKLDSVPTLNHKLLYTNQNYDYKLSGIFFEQLQIRKPDYIFSSDFKTFGEFFGKAVIAFEEVLNDFRPDKILVLGDTNSGLLSIVAQKYDIPIYHMEAGNRCYDDRLPEEANRKIIDSISTFNLPYTEDSKNILLSEGYNRNYIYKIGNPINEVLNYYSIDIQDSKILELLDIKEKEYILVTIHRTENVDDKKVLFDIVTALNSLSILYELKVILSLHPRTKDKLSSLEIKLDDDIMVCEPFGFFDFQKLQINASFVITDSGTVQEECCLYHIPCVTIRNSTERRETIECGSNKLIGNSYDDIMNGLNNVFEHNEWDIPNDYLVDDVSNIVINILTSKNNKKYV